MARLALALALAVLALAVPAGFAIRSAHAGTGAHVEHFTIRSGFVPGARRETLVIPDTWKRGGPLLLWLHARGGDEDSLLTPSFYSAVRSLGRRAPAVVIPSDNRLSFWHDRRGAAWGSYVMKAVLSRGLAISGADPRRVAIGGISMGGFAAYNLARENPGRFCVVGGHSPAIFTKSQRKLPLAFDGPADFARNDLLALNPRLWSGARLWLDVGRADPFAAADGKFAAKLRRAGLEVSLHFWPGRHAGAYWRSHLRAYLRFYADALAICRR